MTLKDAREILGLGVTATRQEITAAFRRAARRWHPDRAPQGSEAEYRARMQEINLAYAQVRRFLENYQYRLEEPEDQKDYDSWWYERFATGVWSKPPPNSSEKKK